MNKVMIDETLRGKLNGFNDHMEFFDESGQCVGHFVPRELYREMLFALADKNCPYTKEELDQFRSEKSGRPLAEIWKSLGRG